MNAIIRAEKPADHAAIAALHQHAFGANAESQLVSDLRQSGFLTTSLVAECSGKVVGHIALSRMRLVTDTGKLNSLSLAPLAVHEDYQRQGIGTRLVEAGLSEARQQGEQSVLVLGQPEYYRRFGFSSELAQPLASPFGGGEAWMALELVPGVLAGVIGRVEFAPPFDALQ